MSSCNKPDFNRLAASCFIRLVKTCYPQACWKLFEQLAASLRITTCSKSDFINLHQLASTLMRSSNLLQVVPSDLSKLDIHRLDASWWNNLHQVYKWQLAARLISSTCISIDAIIRLATSLFKSDLLMQVDICRLDASVSSTCTV